MSLKHYVVARVVLGPNLDDPVGLIQNFIHRAQFTAAAIRFPRDKKLKVEVTIDVIEDGAA